ncbi:MAG: DUF362 domain-containing protein [Thermoanaerobaculaceae bacterium]|nr:DUF362 domain-containing protein [Thermoanaerobaculaceae bacterium]TAM56851.1 MAG: DUF362 domain-containing protein [Acidobacteriota bacterium]
MRGTLNRRELARLAVLGLAAAPRLREEDTPPPVRRGRVGVAPLAAPAGRAVDPVLAHRAVAAALAAATGLGNARAAVAALFRGEDTVGIKVNCLGGPNLSPRVELVSALAALLAERGIPPGRIIVFERSARELERAGFPVRRRGGPFLCVGIDNDYDREPSTSGEIGSCFARLVSTTCTALVSFGVVKDHDLAGVSAGLKNLYGLIHNPNKYHDHNCDPYLADLASHPFVRRKLRLVVLDGVVAQCHGGPAYRPDGSWPLGLVAAATDPVAADAWAWKAIDAERTRRGLPTLAEAKRPPRFLATAERYGLGVGDPAAIVEVRA